MHRLRLLYPLLFAPLRVLYTAAQSTSGAYSLPDLVAFVGMLLILTGSLYVTLALLLRQRWPGEDTALLIFSAVVWFWGYEPAFVHLAYDGRIALGSHGAHMVLLVGGGAATIGSLTWLRQRPWLVTRLTTWLTLTGTLLAGWSIVGIVRHQIQNMRALRQSALVRELLQPIRESVGSSGRAAPRRDIYLIVLDMYGSSAVLREFYGLNNRAFEDRLRQLGFTIPPVVHSNYSHTRLSLPSLLNFSHVVGLNGAVQTDVPHRMVAHNRAVTFLKAKGYRFIFFPSQWWIATQHSPQADVTVSATGGWSLDKVATGSPLRWTLIPTTVLAFTAIGGPEAYARYVRHTFEKLRHIPDSGAPVFVFAHVMSPHFPYVFEPDCHTRPRVPPGSEAPDARGGYLDQIHCINRLVLGFVRDLLRHSKVPPVILLQADHGPQFQGSLSVRSLEQLSPSQLRERFGAFGAYYLPDGGSRLIGDSLTTVNLLPKVFNYYFGSHLPMHLNNFYMWSDRLDSVWAVNPRLLR